MRSVALFLQIRKIAVATTLMLGDRTPHELLRIYIAAPEVPDFVDQAFRILRGNAVGIRML